MAEIFVLTLLQEKLTLSSLMFHVPIFNGEATQVNITLDGCMYPS